MISPQSFKYLYGLIGYPLVHSFSRIYFNNKFDAENIDAQYINFEIESLELFPEPQPVRPKRYRALQGGGDSLP
jgi:shikimate 5-dehydrogenase